MTLLALQDLFRRYREKATGVWTLGKEPGRTIYFDYGDTVFATSTHLQDRLTHLLVEKGKVTQAQMDYALANLKPGFSIGKNLIEMGFITQRDLLDMAKLQVERIIRGALGATDLEPDFESRELDANVVRLPLNTPQLLLGGLLSLQDREALLELLGPLNQVVVLQGRNLLDLSLPADLAKLPPLLDGTHTLLELSREAMAEPLRLGAFALFLREMGWARLHEMPPLDRHALDLALAPEAEATPTAPLPPMPPAPEPALPETPTEPAPSLFTTIQEAARPTTNLEHLSQSLDEAAPTPPLPIAAPDADLLGEPLYLPEAMGGPSADPAESATVRLVLPPGAASAPTPTLPILAVPELSEDAPLPMVVTPDGHLPALPVPAEPLEPAPPPLENPPEAFQAPGEPQEPAPPPLAEPPEGTPGEDAPEPAPVRHRWVRWGLAALVVLAGLAAGFLIQARASGPDGWFNRLRARLGGKAAVQASAPQPPAPPAPSPSPAPTPAAPQPAPEAAPPASGAAPAVPAPGPAAVPKTGVPAPAVPQPAAPAPAPAATPEPAARPAKAAEPAVSTTVAARVRALAQGDLELAVKQGRRLVRELPPEHCALRLEIACQGDTIQRLMSQFKGQDPDVYLLPITLRDGRACYQVLYGNFPNLKAAQKAVPRLPRALHADRDQPKIFRIADLIKLQ